MSTSGVASSAWRKARTIASVFFRLCPALSARCDDIWSAGPSAMGSGNGMPSSTTAAPVAGGEKRHQCGTTFRLELSEATIDTRGHGTDDFARLSIGQTFTFALPHRSHADIDGAQHQYHDRADELHPFLVLQNGAGREQPHPQEIRDVSDGHDDQNPADDLLPADHRPLPSSVIPFAVPDKPPRSPNPCRRVRTS